MLWCGREREIDRHSEREKRGREAEAASSKEGTEKWGGGDREISLPQGK